MQVANKNSKSCSFSLIVKEMYFIMRTRYTSKNPIKQPNRERLMGFPSSSVVKNLPASAGDAEDVDQIPGLGKSPGRGNGNPFQYSCLKNPMNRGVGWATVYGVTKSQIRLSN